MNQTRLSIVMFSAMLSHGGGRETWLSNLLPRLAEERAFDQIDVHYIADAETDMHVKLQICSDPRFNFFQIRLPVSNNKFISVHRIIIFCTKVVRHLLSHPTTGHWVVAVGTFNEGAVLAFLKLLMQHPPILVTWIRGVWSKEINHRHGYFFKQLICSLEAIFLRCSDYIISNGLDTKQYYEKFIDRRVEAIPNALDLKKFEVISQAAFQTEHKTIAYIGRLSEEKGFRSFIDAVNLYFSTYSSQTLSFEIVGDGPLRELAEAFVSANSERPVRYLGPISHEHMPGYLSSIDAGVNLTTSKETGGGGVSNTLLELIGSKRLVIAWDSIIYKQVLDEHQALFVSEGDITDLAKVFSKVDEKPNEMRSYIESSYEILNDYSFENHVAHFLNYLRN